MPPTIIEGAVVSDDAPLQLTLVASAPTTHVLWGTTVDADSPLELKVV